MVKVYYETENWYCEHVASFLDEDVYDVCLPILEADAESNNFDRGVTESVDETEDLTNGTSKVQILLMKENSREPELIATFEEETRYLLCASALEQNFVHKFVGTMIVNIK